MNIAGALRRYGVVGATRRFPRKAFETIRRSGLYRTFGPSWVQSHYGVRLATNWGDATFEMCIEGIYGPFLSDLLSNYSEDFVFMDIGANQGLYSLIAAKNPRCIRAYAFEPVPATFALLQKNVLLNGLSGKITLLKIGISSADATVGITTTKGHSGGATMRSSNGVTETVEVRTAKSIEDTIRPLTAPIVAKVDVEGHEAVVLEGLTSSDLGHRLKVVFYEVDEAWSDPRILEQLLTNAGLTNSTPIGGGAHYDVLAVRE